MTATFWIEERPVIDPRADVVTITFRCGEERHAYAMRRSEFVMMAVHFQREVAKLAVADLESNVISSASLKRARKQKEGR